MAELGRLGGKATAKKHGADYMRKIGLRGLEKRYKKKLKPKREPRAITGTRNKIEL